MAILEVQNVKYRYVNQYQTVDALNGVSCSFEEGRLYALVGKSGSGKSTLLSLLAGLMLPSEGEIRFNGRSTASLDLERYRRENVSVIYQSFRLLPLLTVSENVTYPMEIRGFAGKEARDRAAALIRRVGLPETALDRLPNMLSGGEQQRVAVARAMSMDTRLLLADEPTGNLDTENGRRIIDLLLQLAHEEGYCVIVVTHDPDISARADITYRIRDGVLSEESRNPACAEVWSGGGQRSEELRRIDELVEKAEKRRKKRNRILGTALAACLALGCLLHTLILPALRYSRAVSLWEAGSYEEAIAAFESMDGYRDSETRILGCRYGIAAELRAAGEYDAAIAAFEALEGYADSAAMIETCRAERLEQQYAAALALSEAGSYDRAYPAWIALGDYRDSAQRAEALYEPYKAALLETPQLGASVFFGSYEQDNDLSNGQEDIEWLVLALEDDRALLISRYALDCQRYSVNKSRDSWTSCNIRSWLNGPFLSSAFTPEEQERILDTVIPSPQRQDEMKFADAVDRLFALDQTQIYKYFPSEESRRCSPTAYAVAQGAPARNASSEDGRSYCWWWVRFQGVSNWNAPCITPDGSLSHLDQYLDEAYNAVRPAMWIKLGGD